MDNWTIQEEADHLRDRFKGVNRAEFARHHSVKGGDAYIYQNITARRPLNLDAALAYARGFNVALEDISPRLAMEVLEASKKATPAPIHSIHPHILTVIKIMEGTDNIGKEKIVTAAKEAVELRQAHLRLTKQDVLHQIDEIKKITNDAPVSYVEPAPHPVVQK